MFSITPPPIDIPEEEKNLDPHSRLIPVCHFMKDTAQNQAASTCQIQNFGEPFFLVVHEGERLAKVKARIQKKLQVSDEAFSKWKFAFLSLGHPEYLQDSDIVFNRFQKIDVYGSWEQYLGLEHSDTPTSATPGIFSFGASSSASSKNAVNASSRVSPSLFAFGASSASSQTASTAGIFGSNWQAPKSPGFSSPFSSATPTAFAFGASSSFFTAPTTTAVAFGSAPITPSGPAISFGSNLTNSSSQAIFGYSTTPFTALPGNNNQMKSKEGSMAKDAMHASSPAISFDQPSVSPSPVGFMFGSTPSPFQFGGQQSQPAAQNPSPFAASGSLGAGGSFSFGSSGPDKSG
ncbi:nuclear pore complex protein NUP1-like isoform X1 [Lycium barbarum]|uniref:nuclear pore complex protein NUP1-like isoform X1 n=2 Tax=Lycium barbarum TaxID=112863 RepID=UPI00293E5958|nr:nuclear pore complex protein NUP1-like isoform X1 [Lycium barbarum]